jgi:flagellar basal-body rod modification protein FlgD
MDLSGVLAAANPASTSTSGDKQKFGQDYNQFLRLLTTQLKNQDPLSPMDTAQFTNQLVEFSGVEQQIKSNDYLQKLLTINAAGLTAVGLSYVGLNVQSPGTSITFDGAHPAQMSYTMPTGAQTGSFSILDASGNVVFKQDADLTSGTHNFSWNGTDNGGNPVAAGTYTLAVGAQDEKGAPLSVKTFTAARVTGVQTGEDGSVQLMIGDKLVNVMDIRQANLPTGL